MESYKEYSGNQRKKAKTFIAGNDKRHAVHYQNRLLVANAAQEFGNLYLKDGDSQIFVYGCYPGYGATGDFRKGLIAAKGIKVGDKLTVIATKGTRNGAAQLANGIYFSHESAQ